MIWVGGAFVLGIVVGFFIASRLFYAMQQDFFHALGAPPKDKP